MPNYRLFGLQVDSSLAFPGLEPIHTTAMPDISIHPDSLADWSSSASDAAICFRCCGDQVQVKLPGIARLLIKHGREIIYDQIDRKRQDATTLYLLNHALAILLIQRDILVLHAGAFLEGQQATAIAGSTGQGKSTMLASLYKKGYPVLCDEHVAVHFDNNRATVFAGPPLLQLWKTTMQALELEHRNIGPVRQGLDKYWISMPNKAPSQSVVLSRMLELEWSNSPVRRTLSVKGAEKILSLTKQVYQWPYVKGMSLENRVGAHCLRLCNLIDIERLQQPRSLEQLEHPPCAV